MITNGVFPSNIFLHPFQLLSQQPNLAYDISLCWLTDILERIPSFSLFLLSNNYTSAIFWKPIGVRVFFRNNISVVNLFMQSMAYERHEQQKQLQTADLLSNIAGSMGLFLGMSTVGSFCYEFEKHLKLSFRPLIFSDQCHPHGWVFSIRKEIDILVTREDNKNRANI